MNSLVILISGRGSNMQAIVEAAHREQWPDRVAAVISNRADSEGVDWARSRGISTEVLDHRGFASRDAFDHALGDLIDRHKPAAIALAGFMRVLTPAFVARYDGRLVNIHPSLLPAFPGMHTHRQALQAGVRIHGCTVHFVTAQLDHGPIISQAVVPVMPGDTEMTLAERVLKMEHRIYPRAIRWLLDGRLIVEDGIVRVSIDGVETASGLSNGEIDG